MRNRIVLRLSSNISAYEITLYDGCKRLRKQIFTRQGCVCFASNARGVRMIARPLVAGYSTLLYFWIDTACQRVCDLYFNFPLTTAPQAAINRFTLTDENYGLPIDGNLLFTSV